MLIEASPDQISELLDFTWGAQPRLESAFYPLYASKEETRASISIPPPLCLGLVVFEVEKPRFMMRDFSVRQGAGVLA